MVNPISFVGVNSAIERIDVDGSTAYLCPKANGYKGCHNYDHFALVGAQMALLGKSIKLEAMEQKYDSAPPEMKKYK